MAGEESLRLLTVSVQSLVASCAIATSGLPQITTRQDSVRRRIADSDMLFQGHSLQLSRDALGGPHGPQQIPPGHLPDFIPCVTAPQQLREQRGIFPDILQAV